MRTLPALLAAVLSLAACVHDGAPATREATAARPVAHAVAAGAQAPAMPPAAPSRDQLRAALRARRQHHLDVLHAYREAGIFPINRDTPGDGHYLIDPSGTLCAVANLIAQDGHMDLIAAASQNDNALLFGDVHDGPLMAWILTSGFSQEEIARIQVPAPYVGDEPMIPEPAEDPAVLAANQKVSAYLTDIEATLRANQDAGIELAVSRLLDHPDLAFAMLAPAPTTEPVVTADARFATPPPAN
jgi:hypothetical protein